MATITAAANDNQEKPLIDIDDLHVAFETEEGISEVVKGVSFGVYPGETLALVGESGSGKTVTAMSILKLLPNPPTRWPKGRISFYGKHVETENVLDMPPAALRMMRGNDIGVIFQEPMMSLNPLHTVEKQIAEVLSLHKGLSRKQARPVIRKWLTRVGIDDVDEKMKVYPHQLSGGQQQRVMIAMALANEPELLIADEPTTALDVTIQAQILDLIDDLKRELGMAVLFITHDLAVVKKISDRVAVMRQGELMELESTERLFASPQHEYTKMLLTAWHQHRSDEVAKDAADILQVDDVKVWFPIQKGILRKTIGYVKAVDGISFNLREGESLGIVGESGSGKTTLTHALLKLIESQGNVVFQGQAISSLTEAQMRPYRQAMQLVFQDPYGSLSPRMSVEQIIGEGLEIHGVGSISERQEKVEEAMRLVELNPDWKNRYPNEFSGGQRQRIAIARALVMEPKLIVLDEPTSALDRTIQAQVVELLIRLQKDKGVTYIFITHDLKVVQAMCHSILVMQNGKVVERGSTKDIFNQPKQEYTQRLLESASL